MAKDIIQSHHTHRVFMIITIDYPRSSRAAGMVRSDVRYIFGLDKIDVRKLGELDKRHD